MPNQTDFSPEFIRQHLEQAWLAWQNQDAPQAENLLRQILAPLPEQPDALHLMGVILFGQGRPQEAEPFLAQACLLCPDYDDFFFNWGNACLALQDWPKALQAFARAYSLNPQLAEARFKQGQMLEKLGREGEAEIIWRELLDGGDLPAVQHALARNLVRQGRFQAAETLYQSLTQIPDTPATLASLIRNEQGLLYLSRQAPLKAVAAFDAALQLTPQAGHLYAHKALALFHAKNFEQALEASQQALQYQPHSAETWVNQTQILLELNRGKEALIAFQTALKYAPHFVQLLNSMIADELSASRDENALCLLELAEELEKNPAQKALFNFTGGQAAQRSNLSEQAQKRYKRARQQAPHNFVYQLAEVCQVPVIYRSEAEITEVRSRLCANLDRLEEQVREKPQSFSLPQPLSQIPLLFHLAYQGQNDKAIHSQVAGLWQDLMQANKLLLPPRKHRAKRAGPIKIGFASSYLFAHSVSYCYQGLIEACGKDPEFETCCFYLGQHEDKMTRYLREQVQTFLVLGKLTPLEMAQTIAQQELDILVYLDIGMEHLTYLLGLQRLAPVQYVLAGHPVTTGLPEIDWFVSTQTSEPPEGQTHYSEKLLLLNHAPSSDYRLPEFPAHRQSRSELGLPENKHIYLCPMTLYKVHPAFDPAIAQILDQDPLAEIYFFKYQDQPLHLFLGDRLKQILSPSAHKRVHFLPWAEREQFLQILSLADVLLDPFHFSAGNTAYLSLKAATPLLSWPSQLKRGRIASAFYKRMDMLECIAQTPQEYVEKALLLATNKDYAAEIKAKLAQKQDKVVGHTQGIKELMAHFFSQARA